MGKSFLLLSACIFFFCTTNAQVGTIHTIAGTGVAGDGGDGGKATEALFRYPAGLAVDKEGNVYVADIENHRVRKIDKSGIITTVAGVGVEGQGGDGGPATQARLFYPVAVAFDADGNLYIAETSRIRKVNKAGIISTFAGLNRGNTGNYYYSGDGGPAIEADLNSPTEMVFDKAGNMIFSDGNNSLIRKIDVSGIITTIGGYFGYAGYAGDGGPAKDASLLYAPGITIDKNDTIYITDYWNNMIRKIDPSGIITRVAGIYRDGSTTGAFTGDGGPATSAELAQPTAIGIDQQGSLYVADASNHCIRKINKSGIISTVIGKGGVTGYSGDGGPATEALLNMPYGIAVTSTGIYFTDLLENVVRYVELGPCKAVDAALSLNGLTLLSSGTYASYQWLLNGQPIAGATAPAYSVPTTGSYAVSVTDQDGCVDTSAEKDVKVETNLFVPNVFTPNGDGKNDIFKVYGNQLSKVRLLIFNQWGQKIFDTQDGQAGWDGTVRGKAQPSGVYIYTLNVTLQNGSTVKRKGSISLVR